MRHIAAEQPGLEKRPTRLLLAGGEPASLTHLQQLLKTMGYDIIVVKDGMEALQVLQSARPPGLAVLDWTMPRLNGTDVCRGLRQGSRGKATYVVLLSDWKLQKDRVEALEAGADECLYRPVDIRELRVRLSIGSQTILERALRESEERLRSAFEYAGTGMALAKTTGEFLQVNPALSEFLGYTEEELLAMGVHAIGHPDNQPSSSELLKQFLDSGRRGQEFERKFFTKQGAVAWTLITLSTVLDADQHVTCFFVQFNDITQRKVVEDALQRSEALFRAIMNNMNDLIMVRNPDFKCRYASPSYARHLGYTPQELVGTDIRTLVHPDDLAAVETIIADLRRDEPARVHTFRYLHKRGMSLHVECSVSRLRESGGVRDSLVAVSRVVEDRIQARQKLEAAHAETELFLQSIPSVLIGLDGKGCITRWNPTATEALGVPGERVMGRRLDDCGIQWSQPEIRVEVQRWLRAENACRSELRFEREGQARFLGVHVRHLP
ncbi:MAG: PAS domain S-box protein, partial [Terriglobales bacterium]